MQPETGTSTARKTKLLDQVVNTCKKKHYARKTAETYRAWARDYLLFHRRQAGRFVHPCDLGGADVEAYLTYLAVGQTKVSETVLAIVCLFPGSASRAEGGFQTELLAHLIASGGVARGLAAVDRAALGVQLRLGLRGVDALEPVGWWPWLGDAPDQTVFVRDGVWSFRVLSGAEAGQGGAGLKTGFSWAFDVRAAGASRRRPAEGWVWSGLREALAGQRRVRDGVKGRRVVRAERWVGLLRRRAVGLCRGGLLGVGVGYVCAGRA